MIGIIYKFTILAKVRYDGHKPFYIGQHWCKSKDDFLCRDYPYYGSGTIWLKCIKKLKKSNSDNWRFFVKREILCVITNNSQKTLDKLEEFWIKREKSHHSYELGGCNVLWGTANEFGSSNPMSDSLVVEKARNKISEWWKEHPEARVELSKRRKNTKTKKEIRDKISNSLKGKFEGKKNPMWGKKASDDTRRKMSIAQSARKHRKPHSDYTKKLIALTRKKYVGDKHPLYGCHFTWINNGEIDVRFKGTIIPDGWFKGRCKKKAV